MHRTTGFASLLALLALAGCETMQGAGRDMQTAGQLLAEQSQSAQARMGYTPPSGAAQPYGAQPAYPAPGPY